MRQFINYKNKTKKGLIAIEFVIVMALSITISLIVMAAAKNNNQLSTNGVMKQSKDFFNQKIGEIFGNNPGSGNPGGGTTPPEDATGGIVFQIPSGTAAVFSKQETDETILSWAKTNLNATDKDGNNIADSMQIVSKSLDDTGGFVTLKVTDSQSYSKTANLPVIFEKNDYSILVKMPNGQPYRFIQGIASEDISSWVKTRADITNKELEDISSLVEIEYISGDLSSAGTKTIEIRAKLGELISETVSFQINIETMDISTCNNFATSSTFKSKPIGDGGPLTPYQI